MIHPVVEGRLNPSWFPNLLVENLEEEAAISRFPLETTTTCHTVGICVSICFVHLSMCPCSDTKQVSALSRDRCGECGGLSENGPTGSYRSICSPDRGTNWEQLGGVALLEVWGETTWASKRCHFEPTSLCVLLAIWDVRSQLLLPPCLPSNHRDIADRASSPHGPNPWERWVQSKDFFHELPWSWCFTTAIEK